MSEKLNVIVANVSGSKMVCTDKGDGTDTTVCLLSKVPSVAEEIKQLRKSLSEYEIFHIEHIEDIDVIGEEILCWDGCDWSIDFVDVCPDYGHHYMSNGTEVEAWMKLPKIDSNTSEQ